MKIWIKAIRPKTLTASLIPVLIGTALAAIQVSSIQLSIMISCLLCAFCVQIGTNFINDALDFQNGVDTCNRIGPLRVVQSGLLNPYLVLVVGVAFLFLGALFGLPLVLKGGKIIAFLLVLSVVLAYLYTGGPYPLSYLGLGEIFVFLFFGIVGTCGTFYIQLFTINWEVLIASFQIGFLATALIAINNVRDYEGDKLAGKKTIAVRFGIPFGKKVIIFCLFTPYALNFFWFFSSLYGAFLLPFLTLPLALQIVQKVLSNQPGKIYNDFLGQTALLHLLFGVILSVGILLQ